MSKIICLETSTTNCSVAIYNKNQLIHIQEDNSDGYSHAEKLHLFIEEVIQGANCKIEEIEAIAVSKGPGSYTGLRIGVSTAKGLCFALGIPLISINTLESLAQQQKISSGYIIPMLDARRMEVYTMALDENHNVVNPSNALVLNENSYTNYLDEKNCYFIGSGVTKFKEICDSKNAIYIENAIPSAKELGKIAYQKFLNKDFENVAYFEPFYLKDFQTTPPKKK